MKQNIESVAERMRKTMNITGFFWILEAIVLVGLVLASFFYGGFK